MSKPLNLMLGALATALVTVGVAAQTGTIQLPGASSTPGSGGVQAQQSTATPTAVEASPSAAPSVTPAAEVAPPQPAGSTPKSKKKHVG